MNDRTQLALFDLPLKSKEKTSHIVYIPPSLEIVDKYAYTVCRIYKEQFGTNCTTTEFLQGFRAFVRAVVKAKANQLNKGKTI